MRTKEDKGGGRKMPIKDNGRGWTGADRAGQREKQMDRNCRPGQARRMDQDGQEGRTRRMERKDGKI